MNIYIKKGILAMTTILSLHAWPYQIVISQPSESRAYHRPSQTIEVSVKTTPALKEGDTVAIFLDDSVVANGMTANVPTIDVFAGEHILKAVVRDKNATVLAQDSQTIYVIQTATLAKKKNAAIAQREAYEALPWYEKLLIGIDPRVQAPQDVSQSTPTWEIR